MQRFHFKLLKGHFFKARRCLHYVLNFWTDEGPPGCGKSTLIGMCVIDYLLRERKGMVIADTKYAVGVCAETVQRSLEKVAQPLHGVFHQDPRGSEALDLAVERVDPASP